MPLHFLTKIYCTATLNEVLERQQLDSTYDSLEVVEQLFDRLEEPNSFAKWDKPLFVTNSNDSLLDYTGISASLYSSIVPPPNLSTVVVSLFLFLLLIFYLERSNGSKLLVST